MQIQCAHPFHAQYGTDNVLGEIDNVADDYDTRSLGMWCSGCSEYVAWVQAVEALPKAAPIVPPNDTHAEALLNKEPL